MASNTRTRRRIPSYRSGQSCANRIAPSCFQTDRADVPWHRLIQMPFEHAKPNGVIAICRFGVRIYGWRPMSKGEMVNLEASIAHRNQY